MPLDQTNKSDHQFKALVDLSVESWRFSRLFARVLTKLDAVESARYTSQYRFFLKRLEESLAVNGLSIVNLEGQPFDTGVAATALNISDFSADDNLVIEQMIEPTIMGQEGLVRSGTVMVRKVEA